ncbi:hypothetical protein ACIOG4_28540 [Streptomyces microflavus]|uniref:hypothetical protein n=1 Tax=Streptomyces microflavus TaxID=1919 RepID=UPI00381DB1EF
MCFICRALGAALLARIVGRLLLYGLAVSLLVALTVPARAVLAAARDGVAGLGVGGLLLGAVGAAVLCGGFVCARRGR